MAKKKPTAKKKSNKSRLSKKEGGSRVVHFHIDDEIDTWLKEQPRYFNMSEYLRKIWIEAIRKEGKKSDKLFTTNN